MANPNELKYSPAYQQGLDIAPDPTYHPTSSPVKSQADCGEGMTFIPSEVVGGVVGIAPARCVPNYLLQKPEPKMMGMSANWLVPAILIGVGIYMLTRKSE